jgi:hypothetical protein
MEEGWWCGRFDSAETPIKWLLHLSDSEAFKPRMHLFYFINYCDRLISQVTILPSEVSSRFNGKRYQERAGDFFEMIQKKRPVVSSVPDAIDHECAQDLNFWSPI